MKIIALPLGSGNNTVSLSPVDDDIEEDEKEVEEGDPQAILLKVSDENREWLLFELCVMDSSLVDQIHLGFPICLLDTGSVDETKQSQGENGGGETGTGIKDEPEGKGKAKAVDVPVVANKPTPDWYDLPKVQTPQSEWLLLLARLFIIQEEDKDSFLLSLMSSSPTLQIHVQEFLCRLNLADLHSEDYLEDDTGWGKNASLRKFESIAKEHRGRHIKALKERSKARIGGFRDIKPWWDELSEDKYFDLLKGLKSVLFFPVTEIEGVQKDIAQFWIKENILRAIQELSMCEEMKSEMKDLEIRASKIRALVELVAVITFSGNQNIKDDPDILPQLFGLIIGVLDPMPHSAIELLRLDRDLAYTLMKVDKDLKRTGHGIAWQTVMQDLGRYAGWLN